MRVLLVEDEPDLGAAIKRTLTQQKYLVDWVLDGNDAWAYLENQWAQYTLAIFDWMLPGISGLELCKKLRSRQSPLPVLMLTAKDRMEDKVTGLDAGADDYLVKPFGMAELLARLRALQRRSPQFQPQELTVGNLTLDYGNNMVVSQNNTGKKQEISLTNKEFQLLEYFMKHPNQIVTTEQIRNQLWEVSAEPISNVVAAQMRLLRRKLTNSGCGNMIETLHGTGYRLNLTDESK
ncbi:MULTISPECIES: two-component system response regulator RppA [Nostocales]|uniref:Response regulator transcription factor n=1 Tax=Nostoc punctiforme FACHB-252 TaxID=1357509 RepID=A0ABR8HE30_NOSPU|nr:MULTISPECIES: two-component system response regulator RppA [Nostocales]BAY95165.1 two-component response regulator [Microchaete diplosiphon NIES-3275]EKE97900.1 response regulator receiver domain protein [Tolypothrix sp. PCC 7601]MBD2613976.1 response regulator transcription factor [Nostoc punctiforme FACHB-252]MBE9080717.1 response regulator transcription factor [Tolypothrix sp. LEGE 11397]UYD30332.1 response regulator transcription factor [Tolypothrix sp. PCC 7712]